MSINPSASISGESRQGDRVSVRVLAVCTANVCRSPMAESVIASLVPYARVRSAGIRAVGGQRIHPYAAAALKAAALPVFDNNRSMPLLPSMVHESDLVFCMTQSHRAAILAAFPESAGRVRLLGGLRGVEIDDPIGGTPEAFAQCLELLMTCARDWQPAIAMIGGRK